MTILFRLLPVLNSWVFFKVNSTSCDYKVTLDELNELLDRIVVFMDTNGRLNAPNILLDRYRDTASKALRALGILEKTNGSIRFTHQSHLDYLTIERVFLKTLEGKTTPIDWLKRHDQSLFRRDQVRFLLQLFRDQDQKLYRRFLENIFFEEGIRFHIQHLALITLSQASPPTDGEHSLIKRLWGDDEWHVHVLEQVLLRHKPWLECFTEDSTIPEMLTSGNDAQINEILFLCKRSADVAPEWFEQILTPHWNSGKPEWTERIGSSLALDAHNDTETVFQWRLALARAGAGQREIYNADRLAKRDQVHAIFYFAAIAEGFISNIEKASAGDSQRHVEVDSERFKNLLEACRANSRDAWDALLTIYKRAVTVYNKLNSIAYCARDNTKYILYLLHNFMVTSGAGLLSEEGTSFLSELRTIGNSKALTHARKLAVDVLSTAPEFLADDAVDCFLTIERPLDIETSPQIMMLADRLSAQDPATAAIRTLSSVCSTLQFQRIEEAILAFHTSRERNHVELQHKLIREDYWSGLPNHYGLPQYALLLALPEERLSMSGHRALMMWRGKFGDLSKYREIGPIEALPVVSPIPANRARFVSDDVWIKIVTGNWGKRDTFRREAKDGKYIEACPSNFASSLHQAGQSNPSRYVKLGLRFPGDMADEYFSNLMQMSGLSVRPNNVTNDEWSPAVVHEVEALIKHIANKENSEVAKAICRVVGKRSGENWSEMVRNLLSKYAQHHPNPDVKSWFDSKEESAGSRSLEITVLNSVRCSAIRAVSQLLWAHPDLFDWAKGLCEHVIEDPHPAVRVASFDLVNAICKHDQDLALNLFVRTYEGTDDGVLCIKNGPYLVQALWNREEDLTPIFQRALASSDEKVAELSAYWSTIGHVVESIYVELATRAASGGIFQKVGVVHGYVDLAHHYDDHRAESLLRLASFLNDPEEEVLDASNRIFRQVGFLDTKEAPSFAEEFARSAAFRRDPTSLLHQLVEHEESLLPFVGAIEACVEQLSGPLLNSTQSIAHRNGFAGGDIATIMLRLYQQSETADDLDLKHRCLDQWDALLRARVGTGRDVLVKLDS